MPKKKAYTTKAKDAEANEPLAVYENKRVHIFNSFEEQERFLLQQMAELTPHQLMAKMEAMRKIFLKEHLLPNGKWKPIERKITIKTPFK